MRAGGLEKKEEVENVVVQEIENQLLVGCLGGWLYPSPTEFKLHILRVFFILSIMVDYVLLFLVQYPTVI